MTRPERFAVLVVIGCGAAPRVAPRVAPPRAAPVPPATAVVDEERVALDRAFAAGQAYYWLVESAGGWACERWLVGADQLARQYREDDILVELTFGMKRDGRFMTLSGPSLRALEDRPDRGVSGWAMGCTQDYALEPTPDGLRVVSTRGGTPETALWFRDEAACRAASGAARLARAIVAPGTHRGC